MRTLSIVLLGLLLVALVQQSEAGGKKKRKACKEKEIDAKEPAELQAIEDCINKKAEQDPENIDWDQCQKDCYAESVQPAKGECDGKTKFFGDVKSKIAGVVGKVKGFFGKGKKDSKKGLAKLKEGLDGLVKKAKDKFSSFSKTAEAGMDFGDE